MPLREEAIPHSGLVLPPREQQAPERAAPLSSAELILAVQADLGSGELNQDLRIDRRRFHREPCEHAGDQVGSQVHIVPEGLPNPLGCLWAERDPHRHGPI